MALSSGHHRNGELYDGLPWVSIRDKKTDNLTGVPNLTAVPFGEGSTLGGEPMKVSALLLAGVCTVPMLCAQQAVSPAVELKATSKKVAAPVALGSPYVLSAVCDGAGNIYVRLNDDPKDDEPMERVTALPIRKISPAAGLVGTFRSLDAFPNEGSGRGVIAKDLFATTDGRVFEVAFVHGDFFVVEFRQDGSVKGKTKLVASDLRGSDFRFAVFASGEYLLTAMTGKDQLTPFTGVFAADGRLLKKIYEPEDEDARQRSRAYERRATVTGSRGVDFIYSGSVAAGSDGNIYLLHGTSSPALIYVISPKGDVVRKLRIDAGDPDLVATSIRSHAARLAVQFDSQRRWPDTNPLIKVADLQGNPIADYRADLAPAGVKALGEPPHLAGYDSDGFTFSPDLRDGQVYFVRAKLP